MSSGCFGAGTQIATPSGERPIEAIRVGDEVLSHDSTLGRLTVGRVTRTFVHHDRQTGIVALGDGRVLQTTSNHPFFTPQASLSQTELDSPALSVVEAGQLAKGDTVMVLGEVALRRAPVVATSFGGPRATVYNFTVDTYHAYFADGVLVHNK
jgi:intein/homing endonuclease